MTSLRPAAQRQTHTWNWCTELAGEEQQGSPGDFGRTLSTPTLRIVEWRVDLFRMHKGFPGPSCELGTNCSGISTRSSWSFGNYLDIPEVKRGNNGLKIMASPVYYLSQTPPLSVGIFQNRQMGRSSYTLYLNHG